MEEKILQTKKNGMTMLLLTLLGYVAAIIVFVLGGILLTAEHNVPGVILLVLWHRRHFPALRPEGAEAGGSIGADPLR